MKTYNVNYTKANGQEGIIMVKAQDEAQALKNAAYLCFTGKDFRTPKETNEPYIKPSKQGFAGSHRIN